MSTAPFPPVRIGQGYDVHAFGEGDHIMLGGVNVPHSCGVLAHSDGDVILHALCDAMLGALALGDIGQHFPPSDDRWKGPTAASSCATATACCVSAAGASATPTSP
jgi:2-C-methyl-D-erythritol 2,4-cyclodiphosphate synthase